MNNFASSTWKKDAENRSGDLILNHNNVSIRNFPLISAYPAIQWQKAAEQIDIPRCLGKTDAALADRAVNVVNLVGHHFSECCEPCGLSN